MDAARLYAHQLGRYEGAPEPTLVSPGCEPPHLLEALELGPDAAHIMWSQRNTFYDDRRAVWRGMIEIGGEGSICCFPQFVVSRACSRSFAAFWSGRRSEQAMSQGVGAQEAAEARGQDAAAALLLQRASSLPNPRPARLSTPLLPASRFGWGAERADPPAEAGGGGSASTPPPPLLTSTSAPRSFSASSSTASYGGDLPPPPTAPAAARRRSLPMVRPSPRCSRHTLSLL